MQAQASTSSVGEVQEAVWHQHARHVARQRERLVYQTIAVSATLGISGAAILATYLRFHHLVVDYGSMPWLELFGTLALVAGGVFGMEMYARFAHRVLWHDFAPGWLLHKTHHAPRQGLFEANDVFAVINAAPAMWLLHYGFSTPTLAGSLAFGAGLGITLFGLAYMFIHDGMVHRRFPVGPIARLPYMRRVAAAHQLHHAGKYGGAPWGMFLGPHELEEIPGAQAEVERLMQAAAAAAPAAAAQGQQQ